ncbi:MAG TPA: hypothetical protein VFW11_22865 [Cyclobacteriaceae bacterium]|nr:hypothetical protein [Cyclobacteriaceae bacterium]
MSKISIFEKAKDRLFAACFEPDQKDELDKTFDLWHDFEDLRTFFIQYRKDLGEFAPELSVKDAVKQALTEAEMIYDSLIEFSDHDKLDELFKPLDNRELEQSRYEFQKSKAKAGIRKSILRVYAVKFRDWYVITGSAIKLTDQMDGRPHLKKELKKLELVRKLLQEGNSEGSFVYLDID